MNFATLIINLVTTCRYPPLEFAKPHSSILQFRLKAATSSQFIKLIMLILIIAYCSASFYDVSVNLRFSQNVPGSRKINRYRGLFILWRLTFRSRAFPASSWKRGCVTLFLRNRSRSLRQRNWSENRPSSDSKSVSIVQVDTSSSFEVFQQHHHLDFHCSFCPIIRPPDDSLAFLF